MSIYSGNELYHLLSKTKKLEYNLLADIQKMKAKPHDRFMSEREIIDKYKINQTTVRYALRKLTNQGYIYRINGKGTFISPQQKTQTLLVVSDYSFDSLRERKFAVLEFILGLHQHITQHGLPLLATSLTDSEFQSSLDDIDLIFKNILGVIFFSNIPPYIRAKEVLAHKGIPALYYGSDHNAIAHADLNLYVLKQADLVDKALSEFTLNGHKKIGIVYSQNTSPRLQRYDSYLKWMEAHACQLDPENQIHIDFMGEADIQKRYDLFYETLKIKELKKIASAYFCVDDNLAQYFVNTCYNLGYKIPADFSVISINNSPICHHMIVPLTSVSIPFGHDAGECINMLAEIAKSKKKNYHRESNHVLVRRKSVSTLS